MQRLVFTIEGIQELHRWTHASLGLVLDHVAKIPADDYSKELAGFGFPTLRQQVIHIFNCENTWVMALQKRSYVDRIAGDCPNVPEAKLLQEETRQRTLGYLSGLTEQQLNIPTELRFPDGDTAIHKPSFVLHHVLTHAFHHKGQIVAMCRLLGYPAPDTDLNQFDRIRSVGDF